MGATTGWGDHNATGNYCEVVSGIGARQKERRKSKEQYTTTAEAVKRTSGARVQSSADLIFRTVFLNSITLQMMRRSDECRGREHN